MIYFVIYIIFGIVFAIFSFKFFNFVNPHLLGGLSDFPDFCIFLRIFFGTFWLPLLIAWSLSAIKTSILKRKGK